MAGQENPPIAPRPKLVLRLYIAGNSPLLVRTLVNLEQLRRSHWGDACRVEVIDAARQPLRALADGIMVTPCLRRLEPPPVFKLLGELSDHAAALTALTGAGECESGACHDGAAR